MWILGAFVIACRLQHLNERGVVSERCAPYVATDECPTTADVAGAASCTRSFVSEYYYVGGHYGGCSEEAMLHELAFNGPIVASIDVGTHSSFLYDERNQARGDDVYCCGPIGTPGAALVCRWHIRWLLEAADRRHQRAARAQVGVHKPRRCYSWLRHRYRRHRLLHRAKLVGPALW